MRQSKHQRLTEWWRPKAGTIFSLLLFYLALWEVPFGEGCLLLFFSAITLLGFGFLGYLLNDLADISDDQKAGKTNIVSGIPKLLRPVALLFVLALALFPWQVYFVVDTLTIGLIAAQITLQVVYPLPPIRLKRFSAVAAVTDALYAFVIPSVLALHTFELTNSNIQTDNGLHQVFVAFWMLAMGVRHIFNHHVTDRFNDLKTDTPNLANTKSPYQLRKFIESIVFPFELIGSFGFFFCLLRYSEAKPLIPILLLVLAAAVHLVPRWPLFRVGFTKTSSDSFARIQLALYSLGLLIWQAEEYAVVLALFVLFFTDFLTHPLVHFVFERTKRIIVGLVGKVVSWPSLWFNWTLYYFRKWFLNWSEERNWGEHYQNRLQDFHLNERGNVAIFNWNYQKYSETYIHQQRNSLDYRLEYYYGTPKPLFKLSAGHLVSQDEYLRDAKYALLRLVNADVDAYERRLLVHSLLRDKTQIIVAHFGTMGASLSEVSMESGIPLVVIFHGYDAWNITQIEPNRESYKTLFEVAVAVIGVSKDICAQLQKLGCPAEKITYLPAYFDLNQFNFVLPKQTEVTTFLSVGRFSRTKSPMLLITAFAKLTTLTDNVRLIMIGTDDGESLYETAIMHCKALGIADRVTFKGSLSGLEVKEEMQNASVFVQHSVTTPLEGDKEGTPISVMEAMATGLPVLATRHAGIAEVIEHNVSGILVDEYDLEDMTNCMLQLVKNGELRSTIGSAGAEAIRNNEFVRDNISKFSNILDNHKLAK
ncbi:MAG: colanic acid/amylovoran biosynthesis glycosyltransferase [Flavobacteriales bacterium]|jgi:colanic acid/amylovoran biosynthesis glycosyltransferase